MKYCGLYHLNAYTYADPTWFPDMPAELRAMFQRVTKGALSGNAGQPVERGVQDQRPIRRYAGRQRARRRGRHSVLRRLCREGGDRLSRPQCELARADLHEHQLHEGAPAEHAAPRTTSISRCPRANTPTRSSSSTPASAASWTRSARSRARQQHAGVLHDRQRRLAGRLSRRRLHAVPRHQGHAARRRQPRSGHRLDARQDRRQLEEPRDRRRPRPDGDLRRPSAA